MTVSTKTFLNLQPGVSAADDLRVRTPINQALQWLGEGLPNEINAEFASISASLSNINSALAQISQSVSVQISVHLSNRPTFSANKNSVAQVSISSATDVKITFGTEAWDVGGYFASSTWTPPAGKYRISAQLQFLNTNGVDGEILFCRLYKNGSVHKENFLYRNGATSQGTPAVNALVTANGTDTFEIYGQKTGAGDGAIGGGATDTWFEGEAI